MALASNDQQTLEKFREKLTDRLIADHDGTTTVAHRAGLATARGKAQAIVGAEAEYLAAVIAAHRAASWQTGGAL
jgi:hypothetical protein